MLRESFDDEVKDDAHGAFTPEMMKLLQSTWIETFLEGVTDKITGLSIFKELTWFALQGLWCHVLSVCMCALLVYRGMDSL